MLLLVGLAGCVTVTSPITPRPSNFITRFPAGVWTSRDVPCDYEEVAYIHAEAWTYDGAIKWLYGQMRATGAPAVIDARFESELVEINPRDCGTIPGCWSEDFRAYAHHVSVKGVAVQWVGEGCPYAAPDGAEPLVLGPEAVGPAVLRCLRLEQPGEDSPLKTCGDVFSFTCELADDEIVDLERWLMASAPSIMDGLEGGLRGKCPE
jgi:hypothetical protein